MSAPEPNAVPAGLHGASLELDGLTVQGVSTAGVQTSFRIRQLGVTIDIGTCPPAHASSHDLLLTHGHTDHSGALMAWMGLRRLHSMPTGRIHCETRLVPAVEQLIETAKALARHDFDIEVIGCRPDELVPMKRRNTFIHPFRAVHVVPTLGYAIVERRHKLRAEFKDLPGAEIGRRRKAGEDLFDVVDVPLIAYVGDSRVDVVERNEVVQRARVLLMEATYLDSSKGVDTARAGGHTHLDEILERRDLFQNEHIVLVHLSQIHSPTEARAIVEAKLPESLRERVHLFTRPARRARGDA